MSPRRRESEEPADTRQAGSGGRIVHRLTHSEIIERLLGRKVGASSTVTLTRNAKHETQVSVTVAAGEGPGEPRTALEAAALTRTIYDELCEAYPPPQSFQPGVGPSEL